MKYVAPFDLVKSQVNISTINGQVKVGLTYESFLNLIRLMIADMDVDEKWYLQQYPDIAAAIAKGVVKSAKEHFVKDGYFEGRLPAPIQVDEKWYLQEYPDVAEGVHSGMVDSGQKHFTQDGYREGRLPFAIN